MRCAPTIRRISRGPGKRRHLPTPKSAGYEPFHKLDSILFITVPSSHLEICSFYIDCKRPPQIIAALSFHWANRMPRIKCLDKD